MLFVIAFLFFLNEMDNKSDLEAVLVLSLDAVSCADDVVLVDDGAAADVGRAQDGLQLKGDLMGIRI